MRSFFNSIFLDNLVSDYLLLGGVVMLVFLFRKHLSRFLASLAYALLKRWFPSVKKSHFITLLRKPLQVFLIILAFVITIDHFQYPAQLNFNINFLHSNASSVLRSLKLMILTISMIWVILRVVDFMAMALGERANLTTQPSDNQLVLFFRDFIKVIIGLIGLIILLKFMVGKELVNKFVGALGIGAAALALAAKESIENLIGSFIILFDKPFRIGDAVTVGNMSGNVEKIGLRSTRLRTNNKTFVTVPNKIMVDNILDNLTLMTQRRGLLNLELSPDTPSPILLLILEDIQQILKTDADILNNYTINLNDISRDAFIIQIIYYTHITDWDQYNALKERINISIIKAMETRKVTLARLNNTAL